MTEPRSNARKLAGLVFGRLTVVEPTDQRSKGSLAVVWRCRCECGGVVLVPTFSLTRGQTTNCGCASRRRTHGGYKSREYSAWESMHQRCSNPRNPKHPRYGARGIAVCERWKQFEHFIADMGPCPDGLTLERIDSDGDYAPSNCRWASYAEQNRNTAQNRWVTVNGITLCVQDWCERTGVTRNAMHGRLRKGWSFERIFSTPVARRGHNTSSRG